MSDLTDFSKTLPQLESVDVEAIPTGLEPGGVSSKNKRGDGTSRKKNIPKGQKSYEERTPQKKSAESKNQEQDNEQAGRSKALILVITNA